MQAKIGPRSWNTFTDQWVANFVRYAHGNCLFMIAVKSRSSLSALEYLQTLVRYVCFSAASLAPLHNSHYALCLCMSIKHKETTRSSLSFLKIWHTLYRLWLIYVAQVWYPGENYSLLNGNPLDYDAIVNTATYKNWSMDVRSSNWMLSSFNTIKNCRMTCREGMQCHSAEIKEGHPNAPSALPIMQRCKWARAGGSSF